MLAGVPELLAGLVERPVRERVLWDPTAVEEVQRVTGGHPYFTQLLCDRVILILNRRQQTYVTTEHVQEAVDPVLQAGVNCFQAIFDSLMPVEGAVLGALERQSRSSERVGLPALVRALREEGRPIEVSEVEQALQVLERTYVVRRVGTRPVTCRFQFELMKLWLERGGGCSRDREEVP